MGLAYVMLEIAGARGDGIGRGGGGRGGGGGGAGGGAAGAAALVTSSSKCGAECRENSSLQAYCDLIQDDVPLRHCGPSK